MSNKREREKRREERVQEETKVDAGERRTRLLQFAAGAVFLAIVAVVVLIVVNGEQRQRRRRAEPRRKSATVDKLFSGIPQEELVLGDPKRQGRTDRVRRPAVPGLQSLFRRSPAADHRRPGQGRQGEDGLPQLHDHRRAIGPGRGRGARRRRPGPRLELHRALLPQPGQGELGLRDDEFLDSRRQRRRRERHRQVEQRTAKGPSRPKRSKRRPKKPSKLGFTGTPSFAIKGPSTNGLELLGTPERALGIRRRDRKGQLSPKLT